MLHLIPESSLFMPRQNRFVCTKYAGFLRNAFTCLCWIFPLLMNAQITELRLITPLPGDIHESSGIEIQHQNSIWTHNDSGDSARIFNIDTLGNIIRIVHFSVDSSFDCEESTRDASGNYYLGDFGNNDNNRTNLRIYKIPNPDTLTNNTITPSFITFQYPDQHLFPPASDDMNFDCEAMFHFQDSLYLFSKNRGTSTYCKMYRLPDQSGDYIAELVDSFNTGTWITSADISPSGQSMILLSESHMWLFTNISGTDFFGGDLYEISTYTTLKEAVVFVNDSLIYITDEYLWGFGGNLYQLQLKSWINAFDDELKTAEIVVYPNPAENLVFIDTKNNENDVQISLYDLQGHCILSCNKCNYFNIAMLERGSYFIRVSSDKWSVSKQFVKK